MNFDLVKQSVNRELEKRRRQIETETATYLNLKILIQRGPRIIVTCEEESQIETTKVLTSNPVRV